MQIPFSKFKIFREGQEGVINDVLSSDAKYNIISAPTGVGKTIIGMLLSHHKQPSLYTVSTKMLQDQILSDFPEAVVLKGRSNYPCPRFEEFGVFADSCVKKGCEYEVECPYELAKSAAMQSKYRVFNLSYLLAETNLSRGVFSGQDTIIVDEADHLEQGLVDFISLDLGKRDQSVLSGYNLLEPEYYTKPETWKPWADQCITYLTKDINRYKAALSNTSSPPEELIKNYRRVKRLLAKMEIISKYSDSTWLRYESGDKIIYKPTWLTPALSEQFLFRHADNWIFMSATFPEYSTYCRLLGIPQTETNYIDLPSPFPLENRPVYYNPVANMSYKTQPAELPKMLSAIKTILNENPDVKGVIHATSYALTARLMGLNSSRLLTHTPQDKEQVIEAFKRSDRPLVLVSPSIERGVSFDDDLARFVIIAKVPFQSTQDRIVSARLYSGTFGQDWYQADAAQRIVQMCGRGVRSNTDHCKSYILDSQFTRLIQKPRLFPAWFKDAIVW